MGNDLTATGANDNGTNDLVDQLLMLMIHRLGESLDDSIEKAVAKPLGEVKDSQKDLENRVEKLETKETIDDCQQSQIQGAVKSRVEWLLRGESGERLKRYRRRFFSYLYTDLYDRFKVAKYIRIKKTDFDSALNFVNSWEPACGVQGLKNRIDMGR